MFQQKFNCFTVKRSLEILDFKLLRSRSLPKHVGDARSYKICRNKSCTTTKAISRNIRSKWFSIKKNNVKLMLLIICDYPTNNGRRSFRSLIFIY